MQEVPCLYATEVASHSFARVRHSHVGHEGREKRLAGQGLSGSGTPLLSQKQCHIKRPAPYDARVSSSQAWIIVSLIRVRSASLRTEFPWTGGWGMVGAHSLSLSFARQCGRRGEGMGVRFGR
jgi:hypothetical protein